MIKKDESKDSPNTVRFDRKSDAEFVKTLKKRAKAYFDEQGLSRYANSEMWIKFFIFLLGFFVPYGLMLIMKPENAWWIIGIWAFMGLSMAGIGLSIMHDANHGAFSKNMKVNDTIGYVLNLVGGNALNWKIQHNVLHHTYTNIEGLDEDIMHGKILRFSPYQEHHKFHKAQHIYAWFLYGFMTILWISVKEFIQLTRYKNKGLLKGYSRSFASYMVELVLWKLFYYLYILVIPILVLPVSPWVVVSGFIIMHLLAGIILSLVFQPAHVIPTSEFPLPNEKGAMEDSFLVHQLHTTTNFATKNKFITWYVGGLNYQVEHHLFPSVCHVHYPALSKIVEETTKEFNLPYYSIKTFSGAIVGHGKMLYDLGHGMK